MCRLNEGGYSQTFIQAHIDRLPAEVYDYNRGLAYVNGRSLWWARPPMRYWVTFNLWALRRRKQDVYGPLLAREFQRQKIDVALAEYGPTGVAIASACARAGVPLVVHFHGYDAYADHTLRRHKEDYRRMFNMARAIVAVSHHMQDQLIELGAPPEKLRLNYYGADTSLFTPATVSSNPPTLLSVGRFVEKKAPQLTISAFQIVRTQFPDARLRMVGNGPLLDECRALVQRLNIEDAVDFLGAMDHSAVAEEMRGARAFVQHSVRASSGDSEGTPVAIIEAGVAGLPVISTRHAGIPDVVVEEETGLLVEERDVNAMAAAMVRLLRDPSFAAALGDNARQRAVQRFDMNTTISNLAGILREAAVSS